MFGEWYKLGCMLEYLWGGIGVIIDVLVWGLKKYKGCFFFNLYVDIIFIEKGCVVGVKFRNG